MTVIWITLADNANGRGGRTTESLAGDTLFGKARRGEIRACKVRFRVIPHQTATLRGPKITTRQSERIG